MAIVAANPREKCVAGGRIHRRRRHSGEAMLGKNQVFSTRRVD